MRVWHAVAIAALSIAPNVARAELWAYVDDAGVTHFATAQVDARYRLFFKGKTNLDRDTQRDRDKALALLEQTSLYRRVVDHPNEKRFAALIEQNAKANAVDPALVKAVIAVESAFEPRAVSDKGARGLMQIIPATAARYGLADRRRHSVEDQLFDPATNLRVGVRYLRDLLVLFDDDLPLALAAYNAGEQTVRQYGNRIPPFPETREYVELVQRFHEFYRPAIAPATPSRIIVAIPR